MANALARVALIDSVPSDVRYVSLSSSSAIPLMFASKLLLLASRNRSRSRLVTTGMRRLLMFAAVPSSLACDIGDTSSLVIAGNNYFTSSLNHWVFSRARASANACARNPKKNT